jgi:hypothetical protein
LVVAIITILTKTFNARHGGQKQERGEQPSYREWRRIQSTHQLQKEREQTYLKNVCDENRRTNKPKDEFLTNIHNKYFCVRKNLLFETEVKRYCYLLARFMRKKLLKFFESQNTINCFGMHGEILLAKRLLYPIIYFIHSNLVVCTAGYTNEKVHRKT